MLVVFMLLAGCVMPSAALSATIFLGIGNDGYSNDVEGLLDAVSAELSAYGGVSAYTLANQEGSDILKAIMDIKGVFHPGDTLIWYYSGHSRRVYDINHDETGASSWAETKHDEAIGIRYHRDRATDDQLADAFASIAMDDAQIITIFDTCYAGGFVGGEDDLNSVPGGITFLASSKETEDSWSIDGDTYSLFTQGLINALPKASAHYKGDEAPTVLELFEYAYSHIELTGMPDNISQNPVFWDEDTPVGNTLPVPLPSAFMLLAGGIAALKLRLSAVGRGLKLVSACSTFRH